MTKGLRSSTFAQIRFALGRSIGNRQHYRSYREHMSADRSSASGEHRDGIELANLDQPLGPDAGSTKRDLVIT
jgi:hypothetical protein